MSLLSGCSCHETCGLLGDCCYEGDDKYKLSEQGILKCLYPHTSTSKDLDLQPKYLFVTDPPTGGCAVGSCIYPEIRVPWRNFSPVFSRKKKMNYITEECAKCYGADDAIKWRVIVIFKTVRAEFDLEDLIHVLQNSNGPRVPFVLFTHPGNASEKLQGTCAEYIYKNCQQTDPSSRRDYFMYELQPLFPHFTIVDDDIETMCMQGPLAPMLFNGRMYRNFFCLLCLRILPLTAICWTLELRPRYFRNSFSMMINVTDIGNFLDDDHSTAKLSYPSACKVILLTFCRGLYSPTLLKTLLSPVF